MAIAAPITRMPSFQTAFAAYNVAAALRRICHTDEDIGRAESATMDLFDTVIAHPARDLSSIISKCSAIIAEFGEGDAPTYLVENVLFDLIAMEAAR